MASIAIPMPFAIVQRGPRTPSEAEQKLQPPASSYRPPPLYIRIVFERRGTLYSNLIEATRFYSEHEVQGLLERHSVQSRNFLTTALRNVNMFLLMQRNSVEIVAVTSETRGRERPRCPRKIRILAQSRHESHSFDDCYVPHVRALDPDPPELALRLTVSTCRLRAIYWFLGASVLSILACIVGTLVTKSMDIGLGVGSGLMAMLVGLQSVLLLTR